MLPSLVLFLDEMSTSVSDNSAYPEVCKKAASDDTAFDTFKSNPDYTVILEHFFPEEGLEHFKAFRNNKLMLDNLEKFKINDKLGSPKKYNYSFGEFSPTTLRYIKVLSDLSQLNLNDKTIIEIGPGYGGQYVVLRQVFKPKKYIFIDLDPALQLVKKYVSRNSLDDIELDFVSTLDDAPINCDLLISNYAISECNKNVQDRYIKNYLNNAKNGYMIYNNMNGYTHEDLKSLVKKNLKINQEIPQTHPKNVLITW